MEKRYIQREGTHNIHGEGTYGDTNGEKTYMKRRHTLREDTRRGNIYGKERKDTTCMEKRHIWRGGKYAEEIT